MDDMKRTIANLSSRKISLEERLAEEKVCGLNSKHML